MWSVSLVGLASEYGLPHSPTYRPDEHEEAEEDLDDVADDPGEYCPQPDLLDLVVNAKLPSSTAASAAAAAGDNMTGPSESLLC